MAKSNKKITGITLEIDGDMSKLNKQIKSSNKETRGLQRELKQVDKLLKFNPRDTELLAQKQKILGDTVSQTKDKLLTLEKAQSQVNEQFKRGEISDKQYREFNRELIDTRSHLQNLQQDLARAKNESTALYQALEKTSQNFIGLGKQMQDVGAWGTARITAPIAAAAGVFSNYAMTAEDSINKVSTLWDDQILSMDVARQGLRNLSDTYGIEFEKIAEATYTALSSGVQTQDVLLFVEKASISAASGFAELNSVVDLATTIQNNYGEAAGSLTQVLDLLISTQDNGKITMDEMVQYMGKAIPSAEGLEVSFNELAAAFANSTKRGLGAAATATTLKSLFDELGNSTSKSSKELQRLTGKTFKELKQEGKTTAEILAIIGDSAEVSGKELKEMFGSTTAGDAALKILAGEAGEFDALVKDMAETAGLANKNYDKLASTSRDVAIAITNIKNNAADLGGFILPVLSEISNYAKAASDKFKALDESTKENIVQFAGFLMVAFPVISLLGKGVETIGVLTGASAKLIPKIMAMQSSTLLLGGGFALLVAGGVLLYKNWDAISSKAVELKNNVINNITNMKDATLDRIHSIKESFKNMFNVDIKIPKFSITGKFGLKPPSVPKVGVNWNAKGGVFTKPTIFNTPNAGLQGVGEAGPEAILPLKKIPELMRNINGSNNLSSDVGINGKLQVVITGPGAHNLNNTKIAKAVEKQLINSINSDNRRLPNRTNIINI